MEYLLHLGAHRTGTTALQRLLLRVSALRNAEGIGFWGPQALRGWGLYFVLDSMIAGTASEESTDGAKEVLNDYVAEASAARRIVVSDENLLGSLAQNYQTGTLYPEAEARLQVLKQLLPAPPDTVLVTLRNPVGFWESAYAHLALREKADRFDAERLAQSSGNSWLPALSGIRTAFPHARLRVFDYDETIVARLLNVLVGPDLTKSMPAPSRTLGVALPDWTKPIIEGLPPGRKREELILRIRAEYDRRDRAFLPEQAARLAAGYAQDWADLRAGAIRDAQLDPQEAGVLT